jgi:uncharacterized protein YciI
MMRRITWMALGVLFAVAVSSWAEEPAMPEMTTYYFGMLLKAEKWTPEVTPESTALQEQHMAHIVAMDKAGRLVLAGPLLDDGTIRGLLVYKAASLEEAKAWAEADPAVKAGRLKVEMHPWMVKKGILP